MSAWISNEALLETTGRWDYAALPGNVRLGEGCFLERKDSFRRFRSTQPVGLQLGSRVRVCTWTEFNIEPSGSVIVGDDSILVGAVFMCAGNIHIGARVVISYNVTIADSDFHPIDPQERIRDAIANAPGGDKSGRPRVECRPIRIGNDVEIGIGAILLKGVRIGDRAKVGAGAVVTRDVPEGMRVEGNPARINPPEEAR